MNVVSFSRLVVEPHHAKLVDDQSEPILIDVVASANGPRDLPNEEFGSRNSF
jgi:hypothetical protein